MDGCKGKMHKIKKKKERQIVLILSHGMANSVSTNSVISHTFLRSDSSKTMKEKTSVE